MKKPAFNVGDEVWIAGYDQREKHVECPDCMGKRAIKVTLPDGTEYSLACAGCSAGFEPPRGLVARYERTATAWHGTVERVELRRNPDVYWYGIRCRSAEEGDVFATFEEAKARAADVIRRQEKEDARIQKAQKENTNRTWAWHVHYYRRQIREAKQTIERATGKLNVAREKAKEKA